MIRRKDSIAALIAGNAPIFNAVCEQLAEICLLDRLLTWRAVALAKAAKTMPDLSPEAQTLGDIAALICQPSFGYPSRTTGATA